MLQVIKRFVQNYVEQEDDFLSCSTLYTIFLPRLSCGKEKRGEGKVKRNQPPPSPTVASSAASAANS